MNPTEKANAAISKSEWRRLLVGLGAYALVFFVLAARKFYVMNSNTGDMSVITQALWNTLQGRFFHTEFHGISHFGVHVTFAIMVVFPLFWLFPGGYTLLFMQSVVLAAAGLPFYLLARRVLQERRAAALMTVAFLFYPTVVTTHLNQVHWEYWSLPYLLAALYLLLEQRFWPFAVFCLLGMTGQENLPLTVGMIGVYAAVRRYPLKYILTPIGLAIAYGWLAFKVILPHFAGKQGYAVSYYFGSYGSSPGELIKTCLTQPWVVIAPMFDLNHALYLLELLQPLLWIVPLLTWEFLLVLPSLGVNLMVSESAFRVIGWHYNPTVGALLCVAAVFGVRRLGQRLEQRRQLARAPLALAFTIAALSVASWPLWLNIGDLFPNPYFSTMEKALERIPPDKSVLAPVTMLGHFADRGLAIHLLQFNPNQPISNWPRERMYTLDYVILDYNERRFPDQLVTPDLVNSFWTNANYECILNENNMFVFHRRQSFEEPK